MKQIISGCLMGMLIGISLSSLSSDETPYQSEAQILQHFEEINKDFNNVLHGISEGSR